MFRCFYRKSCKYFCFQRDFQSCHAANFFFFLLFRQIILKTLSIPCFQMLEMLRLYTEQTEQQHNCYICYILAQKKDGERSIGKGQHICLRGRMYSIPCQASYFDQDDFEVQDEFILFFKIILVQFIILFKLSSAKQLVRSRN